MNNIIRQPVASRRQLLLGGSMIGVGLLTSAAVSNPSATTEAETSTGQVRGFLADGVVQFRGIPYGGDTGGQNRFMPPTPVTPWSGVRDATEWGHVAPQPPDANTNDYGQMTGWSNFRGGMGEECLNLNIWTPAVDGNKRAVMVMLHGGGFTSGSGNLEALEGHYMAREGDVVVVNVTHRLGALGYSDLSSFGVPGLAKSGNVGMMDIVQALQWVHDNIENFGGDPTRVAISGQSGGGGKVSTLQAMPSASGLFHRAVIQSGSTLTVSTPDVAQSNTQEMLDKLGVADGDLAKLRSLPFEQIIAAQGRLGPVVDGDVLPRQPFDPDAPAISAQVPLMIGTCLEDWSFAMPDQRNTPESLDEYAELQAPGHGAEVVETYRRAYPDKNPFLTKGMIATDIAVRQRAATQASLKSAQPGAPAYLYRWDWPIPGGGGHWGATHGADLSLSMSNPATAMTQNTPEAQTMASKIGPAVIAFTKTGNPNCEEIPEWPAYDPQTKPVMIFDIDTRVENDPDSEIRMMWERLQSA